MTSAPLVSYSASDPIGGFVAQLRTTSFSGEVMLGIGPRVRLFVRNGAIYLAEREGDAPLPSRLVAGGALSPEQLARGVMLVDGVMSLSKLFVREPSVDRTSIELAISQDTQQVLASVANDPIVDAEFHPDHHHSSGIHEWLSEADATSDIDVDVAVAVEQSAAVEAVPEPLHMPDSSHLADPLPAVAPRRIEPIRIEPIRVEPLRAEPAHPERALESVGAEPAPFAPPPFTESALLAPPPLPTIVGMEEMSAFEQQFHVDLVPTGDTAGTPDVPDVPDVPETHDEPVDDVGSGDPSSGLTLPALPVLPTLASSPTAGAWQNVHHEPEPHEPSPDLSTLDLPKLAATSKSVAEIVAEQERALAPEPEPAVEAAPATGVGFEPSRPADPPSDPFASLPRFADLVGGDPTFATSAAAASPTRHGDPVFDTTTERPPLEPQADIDDLVAAMHTAAPTTTSTAPVFETETLWTPPPADLTASEIWHLLDDMDRPEVQPTSVGAPAPDERGHRFRLGRRSSKD